ncbi:WecB/TagA/CpsF family glycosyltransferase, partial [Streptomyces fulvoviolaceus]
RLNSFDLVTPDGQPVRWALNMLHGAGLTDRVCGPTLTLHVLRAAADEGLPVYLYGSTEQTLDRLMLNLQNTLPALKIAGHEASKFRTARPGEDAEIAARITASGARIVLVGLGCPRQETFVHAMRPLLPMPLLAVGAAFD